MSVLISADELATALDSDHPPVLLDVRWQLGGPPGHESYLEGHLPGAVYVDLETELAGHGEPTDGRHPLPAIEDLQAAARRWGISEGDTVVAYDAVGDTSAARAWWLLRWAGVADVRLLDGALAAWTEAGHPVATDDVAPASGTVTLSPGHLPVLPFEQVADYDGVLLDARAAERYRGEVEPVDPKAGHIPGAASAPTVDNLGPDGRFLPAEELRARFAALGVEAGSPVATYCGSGVTACVPLQRLILAGREDARLYPGSWSDWSSRGLPVERA